MRNQEKKEQAIVPAPIKFVHNFLQSVSHTDKKSNKQHLNFLRDALVELLDHDAFESHEFRSNFSAAITYFEIQSLHFDGYSPAEIEQGIAWAIKKIESEVKNA